MKTLILLNFLILAIGTLCEAQTFSKTNRTISSDTLMVRVAGGTFQMGSGSMSIFEQPVHSVTLSSYSIDITEVTFAKWTAVRDWGLTHGYTDLRPGANGYNTSAPNQPVVEVNWWDAIKWCNARSEMEGISPVYYTDSNKTEIYRTGDISLTNNSVDRSSDGYRLPTEAEWEFAAIGGNLSNGYTYSGGNNIDSVGWYTDNSNSMTHPVKSLLPNELGIYDMSGNAAERCWDRNGDYTTESQTDPLGPVAGPMRCDRGGHFGSFAIVTVSKHRSFGVMNDGSANFGFRCVRGSVSTDIDNNEHSSIRSFELEQNYPNPFNPSTLIKYSIPNGCFVKLKVFDVIGNQIATLVSEEKAAGEYIVEFNSNNISSGIYFYRLESEGKFITEQMLLIK